jgi:sulfatase maturation enzyme AslB (radical SAM superfamily)
MFIGWNRFFPSLFIMNNAARGALDKIEKKIPIQVNESISRFIEEAREHKFLYEGEKDPYRDDFFKIVNEKLEEVEAGINDFYLTEKDYGVLKIETDRCNLACPYCVNEAGISEDHRQRTKKIDFTKKQEIIDRIIDQFFRRKIKNGVLKTDVAFNGGEILVEWPMINIGKVPGG